MLGQKVDILNFDNLYLKKNFYKDKDYNFIDLKAIKNNTYYCEKSTLKDLEDKLTIESKANFRFIGSGNYHYITYLYLKRIARSFDLVLFDNHTEMLETPLNPYISCGSWLLHSFRKLDKLKNVVMIGTNKKYYNTISKEYKSRVNLVNLEDYPSREAMIEDISKFLTSERTYISIDKDVLRSKDSITNWDHGSMSLEDLIFTLDKILDIGKIVGVDVCGEYNVKPFNIYSYKSQKALNLNNRANRLILNKILRLD